MQDQSPIIPLMLDSIAPAVARFRHLVAANESNGRHFTRFDRGAIAAEEGYKLIVRKRAKAAMAWDDWSAEDIGSGLILERVIAGIEVDGNNLLQVEARKGEGTETHTRLLQARGNVNETRKIEEVVFALYRGSDHNPAQAFSDMVETFGAIYPLIGYLWFLKDPLTYTPLRPTGLENGLKQIGISYSLRQKCSWENYKGFLDILHALRPILAQALDLDDVALIEAHSFVWVVGSWKEPAPDKSRKGGSVDDLDKASWIIADRIMKTVDQSNGQVTQRIVKEKTTSLGKEDLILHIKDLLSQQAGKCAITGLSLQLPPNIKDPDLAASPDRIDSSLGYVPGNIQMLCWFVNRWKSDDTDQNFRRLIDVLKSSPSQDPMDVDDASE